MREGRTGQSSAAFLFAALLVLPFFAGPLIGFWLVGPRSNASTLVSVLWFVAFPLAGAFGGHVIAGRRGQFAFAAAFGVVFVAALLALSASVMFHDRWRRYENSLDILLFSVVYPLTFAVMGAVGGLIAARDRGVALTTAKAFGRAGLVGVICFGTVMALRIRGNVELALLVASIAIPAFLGARRVTAVLSP